MSTLSLDVRVPEPTHHVADHRITGRPVSGYHSLSPAERTVIELVATGLTNRQVADALFLSHHTVASHLKSVYMKMSVRTRLEAALLVYESRVQSCA